jgi:hypothetical protein
MTFLVFLDHPVNTVGFLRERQKHRDAGANEPDELVIVLRTLVHRTSTIALVKSVTEYGGRSNVAAGFGSI